MKNSGISLYTSINLYEKFEIFGRFDSLFGDSEEVRFTTGIEYEVNKFIKLAPNVQIIESPSLPTETFIFLSLLFNL